MKTLLVLATLSKATPAPSQSTIDLQRRMDRLNEESAAAPITPPSIPTAFRVAADHNAATIAWFNGLPDDLEERDPVAHAAAEERLTDALNGVEAAPIATLHELAEAISIGCDGGTTSIEPEFARKLLAAARGLAGGALIMCDNPSAAASPIRAMHARYEEACQQYNVVEAAEHQARANGHKKHFGLQRAMQTLSQETDALRNTILHQVPETWSEALLLQFHISNATDLLVNGAEPPSDEEKETLIRATDTLFDFMCCELGLDHEELGTSFKSAATRVHFQRRCRAGQVED